MSGEQFKYDVAFSFSFEDEPQATGLNDLIQDRFSTLLYSRRQEVLAGTDGEESFSCVYATEARFVVVFLREKWGHHPRSLASNRRRSAIAPSTRATTSRCCASDAQKHG